MYTSILKMGDKEFKGTLDMYVLKKVQEDLMEMDIRTTIPSIFYNLSKLDMRYITAFVINSISRLNEKSAIEFTNAFMSSSDENEQLEKFNSIFTYINNLMKKCTPSSNDSEKEESIFEDDYLLYEYEDWELDYMEYIWVSVIGRSDNFWSVTPKNFFEQINIHKKFNNIKDEKVEMF